MITKQDAEHIAVAFQKEREGFRAEDILYSLAFNLGLHPFGKHGEQVIYNPLIHEDIKGGLVPGDICYIKRNGWNHGENVVVRALVKNSNKID